MRKSYALVYVAYEPDGENPCFCLDIAAIAYHKLCYENIAGYSLGHTATFYASLKEAKNHPRTSAFQAIVEFDLDQNGKLTNLCRLYTYHGVRTEKTVDIETDIITETKRQCWKTTELVRGTHYTKSALDELSRQHDAHQQTHQPREHAPAAASSRMFTQAPQALRMRTNDINRLRDTPRPK